MAVVEVVFWLCVAALVWTHAAYPLLVATASRVHARRIRVDDSYSPTVAVIVAAYNEESVIERRIDNLRALDYPDGRLDIVVTSDASTDRTEGIAEAVGARGAA